MPEEKHDPVAPKPPEPPPAAPASPPEPPKPPTQPKVEVKDGVVTVDGKKYVKESDLMAAKESLTAQLNEAQKVHNEAVDKLKLDVSAAQTQVAQANAALDEAKKARTAGDISAEELSRIKKESEDAKAKLATSSTSVLDYRRKYIMAAYNIPANSDAGKKLMEKDSVQLDSFEEAIKALNTGRGGPGNYILGNSGGGATPVPEMDRAKALLAATPFRGVRNEPKAK